MKNDSLEVPSGIEGIVIDTQKFSRRMSLSEDERKVFEKELKEAEAEGNAEIAEHVRARWFARWKKPPARKLNDDDGTPLADGQDPKFVAERAHQFRLDHILDQVKDASKKKEVEQVFTQAVGRTSKPRSTIATASSTA